MGDKSLFGNWSGSSGDGFMQPRYFCFDNYRQIVEINIEPLRRPNHSQLGAVIPGKVRPNGRTKHMRTKLTNDQRCNLRITILYTSRDIWR